MTVWQDLAQIEKLYGPEGARILKGSTDSKMAFRIGEYSTAEWIAKELGEQQYDQVVYPRPGVSGRWPLSPPSPPG